MFNKAISPKKPWFTVILERLKGVIRQNAEWSFSTMMSRIVGMHHTEAARNRCSGTVILVFIGHRCELKEYFTTTLNMAQPINRQGLELFYNA